MKPSAACFSIIKAMEGLRLEVYLCPAGLATVGYGHRTTLPVGTKINQAEADALLEKDVERFAKGVLDLTKGIICTQGQFNALVSFSFNVGLSNLGKSTLLAKLLKGDTKGAAEELRRWNRAGGKVLKGLVLRRELERAEFMRPDAE